MFLEQHLYAKYLRLGYAGTKIDMDSTFVNVSLDGVQINE